LKAADAALEAELTFNPERLTPELLQQNRGRISVGLYGKLSAALQKPERILEASVEAGEVSRMLFDYGMDDLARPGTDKDAVRRSVILRSNIEQRIDEDQRSLGRALKPEEKREIIRGMIVDQAYTTAWGRDPQRPVAVMTTEEIGRSYYRVLDQEVPVSQYRAGVQALQKEGIAMPTDEQIVEWWTLKGKPK
jgi:hypothetical protein